MFCASEQYVPRMLVVSRLTWAFQTVDLNCYGSLLRRSEEIRPRRFRLAFRSLGIREM